MLTVTEPDPKIQQMYHKINQAQFTSPIFGMSSIAYSAVPQPEIMKIAAVQQIPAAVLPELM